MYMYMYMHMEVMWLAGMDGLLDRKVADTRYRTSLFLTQTKEAKGNRATDL